MYIEQCSYGAQTLEAVFPGGRYVADSATCPACEHMLDRWQGPPHTCYLLPVLCVNSVLGPCLFTDGNLFYYLINIVNIKTLI